MHKVETTKYGIRVTPRGKLDPEGARQIQLELARLFEEQTGPFCLLIDAREFIPPESDSLDITRQCEAMAVDAGLIRMAVILQSPVLKLSHMQMAHKSGTARIVRYIDSSRFDDPEMIALQWLIDGVEPPAPELPPIALDQNIQF